MLNSDAITALSNLLAGYRPVWAIAFAVAVILSWRTPQIIRELRRKPKK